LKARPFSLCGLLLGACGSLGLGPPPERWIDARFAAAPSEELWTVIRTSLRKADFPRVEVDHVEGTAETGWYVSAHPFARQGFRERAHVRLAPEEEGAVRVSVRIERERNTSVRNPLDLEEAEWKRVEDSVERAQFVLYQIASLLKPDPSRRPPGSG
jgi:hypothetical protein